MARIGDIMVDEGLVCPEDVDQALSIQSKDSRSKDRLFGKVLCDLNLVTPMDNYCVLEKYKKVVSVKDFLVQKNIAPEARLEEVEAHAAQKEIPFISGLLEAGVLSKAQLKQILFELFHIPFRSVSDIVFSEDSRTLLAGVLDRVRAARHKMVPLQLSGNNLVMGITDPANLVFLRDLDRGFPQYRFTPVFITFSGFTWFYKLIYKDSWLSADPAAEPVNGAPRNKGGELSDPFDFSVTVIDPDRDEEALNALFERYETCCGLGSAAATPGTIMDSDINMERRILFFEFIRRNHREIAEKFNCRSVEFSLKHKDGRTVVTALPGTKGE
ncbi:MAG: hypothetical protein HUN04_14575 [Desulfobacter sp.]|nr:MAG: hypothetical protein HUN04_14575 [Desulfobacter sp.]